MPWSVDSTSGAAVPADATECDSFLASLTDTAIARPTHLYLDQEGSGDLADAIDTVALTPSLAPNNPGYDQSVGWTRLGVGVGNLQPQNFSTTDASMPDLSGHTSASSFAFFGYLDFIGIPGAGTLSVFEVGNGDLMLGLDAASHLVIQSGANVATGTQDAVNGPNLIGGGCIGALVVYNATENTLDVYTQQERFSCTPGVMSSLKRFALGGVVRNAADTRVPYHLLWVGAAAETIGSFAANQFLIGAGATVTWFVLAADAGAVTLAGQDVVLRVSMPADAGAVTLAGQDVAFPVVMTADPGTIVLTGMDVGFHVAMTADPGAVVLTGQAAGFMLSYRLVAASGTVHVIGADATLAVIEGPSAPPVGPPVQMTGVVTAASSATRVRGVISASAGSDERVTAVVPSSRVKGTIS